jgi:hypothetical protein
VTAGRIVTDQPPAATSSSISAREMRCGASLSSLSHLPAVSLRGSSGIGFGGAEKPGGSWPLAGGEGCEYGKAANPASLPEGGNAGALAGGVNAGSCTAVGGGPKACDKPAEALRASAGEIRDWAMKLPALRPATSSWDNPAERANSRRRGRRLERNRICGKWRF